MRTPPEKIEQAAVILAQAKYGVALTGAGISTPSGIPDFRSPGDGLWVDVEPMVVASISGFRRDPKIFFEWMRPLTRLMLDAEPNPAHTALARLQELGKIKELITQNIDNLHTRAGSIMIHEVHGHLRTATCIECYTTHEIADKLEVYVEEGVIPRCNRCGGILKPDVILFGEQLPVRVLMAAKSAAHKCDVMLVAGSSLLVAPVSELPLVAATHGAQIIVVNLEKTYINDRAAVVIQDDVAEVLPLLVELVEEKGG